MPARVSHWWMQGFKDGQESIAKKRTIFKRAPGPSQPAVPDYMLPEEWQEYFEGFEMAMWGGLEKLYKKIRRGIALKGM